MIINLKLKDLKIHRPLLLFYYFLKNEYNLIAFIIFNIQEFYYVI